MTPEQRAALCMQFIGVLSAPLSPIDYTAFLARLSEAVSDLNLRDLAELSARAGDFDGVCDVSWLE